MPLKFLGGGYAAYRHVRAFIIVRPEPLGCGFLGFFYSHKHVLIKPVIANRSVIAFDISVLLRVAWLDKYKLYAVLLGPICQGMADIFRAIIPQGQLLTSDRLRFAAPFNDLIKRSCYPQGRQRNIHLDR